MPGAKPDDLHAAYTRSAHRIARVPAQPVQTRTRTDTQEEGTPMTHRVRRLTLIAATVALATIVAACGETRESSSATTVDAAAAPGGTRTVDIAMQDIKFDQTTLTVKAGETVDFRFTNTGKIAHDAFIGDTDAQMEHETEMAQMGDMSHSAEEAAITVQPGASGELAYTFTEPGTYEVGCHQPGHYGAGMKIEVTVG